MNVLSRPLLAAVLSLFVLLTGAPALGQNIAPEIVEAAVITEDMAEQIDVAVSSALFDLINEDSDPEEITEARQDLLRFFRANQASPAYLDALSAAIGSRIGEGIESESRLVRINATIVLGSMVDEGSEQWIDKGLEDELDAIKRLAMEALGKRMLWWKEQGATRKIDDAIKKIVKIVDDANPPHPIVVGPALEALVRVDTPASRSALLDLLSKRVAAHAADPDLTYAGERAAIEGIASVLPFESPLDVRTMVGLARVTARYSALIVGQFQENQILEDQEKDAQMMILQSMESLVRMAGTLSKEPPANQGQIKNWINNGDWDELMGLVEDDWGAILRAEPFNLGADDLKP